MHDWRVEGDKLYFFAHVDRNSDIVVVYAEEDYNPPARFCPMTGKPLTLDMNSTTKD